jgi:hypothetical protein
MGSPYLYRVEAYTKSNLSRNSNAGAGTDLVAQGDGAFLLYGNLGLDDNGSERQELGYDGTHMHHWIFCRTATGDAAIDEDAQIILEGAVSLHADGADSTEWYHLQETNVGATGVDRTVLQTDARAFSGMTYPYTRIRVIGTGAGRVLFDVMSFRNVDIRRTDIVMPASP